ncbi:MAG: RIP metalloprotease RseP [Deltaproteobacteria bacterium]|nr:RIP metalloprotease RseP [Deltaproteobacteria bacterium]
MLITLIAFLIVLGILVFIHELGHFLAARHVGVRVEAFSVGFPPTLWGKKYGDTEYRISWIPVGGYVKLFGQNVDDEDPDDPTNYASKTIFQRFYILTAGPMMNLLFASIFMPLVFWIGMDTPAYLDDSPRIKDVQAGSYSQQLGIQAKDEIIAVNGTFVKNWQELHNAMGRISPAETMIFDIDRGGNSIYIEGSAIEMHRSGSMGWSPYLIPVVGGFSSHSPAERSGIKVGDKINRINGLVIRDWSDISPTVQKLMRKESESPSSNLIVEIVREAEVELVEVTPFFEPNSQKWLLGMSMSKKFRSHSIVESFSLGISRLWFITKATFSFLGQMFQGEGSMNDLGGPVKIGMVIGDAVRSGISDLFFLMAFISLQLGIFNLLPIPALDGGHILMLLLEKINGKPLSTTIRERTQMIGFSVLMFLMIFVTFNDLVSLM